MKTTRIKWNEEMLTRCLARLTYYHLVPGTVRKKSPAKAADSDCSFKLDIPSASPSTIVKEQKKDGWDDFKTAISKAL